ncbi:hypothetical protein FJY94_05780 [Candidatus Kaiserbacteria bacterium]|nr:hypothetical protein [Candidatus Kaiserbacteria bacterium]
MSYDVLDSVEQRIAQATRFADVFGAVVGPSVQARQSLLRRSFAQLAKFVHPDHVPAAFQKRAQDAFDTLNKLRDSAHEALSAGTYDSHVLMGAERSVVLTSSMRQYVVDELAYATGDYSVLHRARAGSEPFVLKIAREPACNAALERDMAVRSRFADTAYVRHGRIGSFVPKTADTFLVEEGGRRLRVEAMPFQDGFVSVEDLLTTYPRGLLPEDAGWVARRVMAQAIAAQAARVVHTAIIPEHVLVHPLSREPLHLGWAHALDADVSARVTQIVGRRRAYYPPEVFAHERVGTPTDIYMAGKVIIALFGGDVERNTLPRSLSEEVRRSILACTHVSPSCRPQTPREALDGFTRAIRAAWGKTYRPLVLPGRASTYTH